MTRLAAALAFIGLLAAAPLMGAPEGFVEPSKKDKCPVCGMFVGRYRAWLAEIVFSDGGYLVFDGAKDFWRCWFDMKRYAPGRRTEGARRVFVTDYYSQELIDGERALYVLGSDVYGPMGKELIPFAGQKDAEEFMADHKGTRILRLAEIRDALIELE